MPDTPAYRDKKAFFDRVLTVYGRKPVLETLADDSLQCHAVHLADSNRPGGIIAEITSLAEARGVPVKTHSREQLSRISRNGRQDQGAAVDVICPAFSTLDDFLASAKWRPGARLLGLDGIGNPQNLGMLIRSAAAGGIDGILLPGKGAASLGPLVIKASAGTVFRAPLILCPALAPALATIRQQGGRICVLDASAAESLFAFRPDGPCVYVLGNETTGVSPAVEKLADQRLSIPMQAGVESLNVAVTAGLIAFAGYLER